MPRSTFVVALLSGFLASAGATRTIAQPPPSPDLTGTWEGSYTCDWLEEGVPSGNTVPGSLEISHVSDSEARARVLPDDTIYNGFAVGWVGEPERGAVTFVECRTSADSVVYNETMSARFNTATGALRGRSTFNRDFTLMGGFCKLTYTRIDTADPGVPACPVE